MTKPVFVLSLPRSGSTLVQRVLAAHEEIATAAEPWLLLPHGYALRERGMAAEYTQPIAARAIREFVAQLPAGEDDYWAALGAFAMDLYTRGGRGRRHVLPGQDPPLPLRGAGAVPDVPPREVHLPVAQSAGRGVLDRRHVDEGQMERGPMAGGPAGCGGAGGGPRGSPRHHPRRELRDPRGRTRPDLAEDLRVPGAAVRPLHPHHVRRRAVRGQDG